MHIIMRMNVHIGKICSRAFRGLFSIRQIRTFLTVQSTKSLIHAFVSSHLDYCNDFFLVYQNINLIVYRKFRMPRLEWFFRLLNLIISHPYLSTYNSSNVPSSVQIAHFCLQVATQTKPTLRWRSFVHCPWNQLLIMHFARLHNLSCSFLKSTALPLGIGPLLMLHLFYRTRCH